MRLLPAIALTILAGVPLAAGSGFGLGLQTAIGVGESGAIVPRLDYLYTTDSASAAGPVTPINLSTSANIFCLGADYDYYFGGEPGRGLYALGGLGVAIAAIEVSGSTTGDSQSTTSHQTVAYPELGAGYQFNRHVGLEVLYKDVNFSNVTLAVAGVPIAYSYSGILQASLVLRF